MIGNEIWLKLAQKGNIWFDSKSNNFSLIGFIFSYNSWPNSLQYKYMMILHAQGTNFWPQEPYSKLQKLWHSSNLATIVSVQFKAFQALQSIPGGPLIVSRYSQTSQACRIITSKSRFAHFKLKIDFYFSCIFNMFCLFVCV